MDEILDELAAMGYMKPFNEELEEWKRRKRMEALDKEEQGKQTLSEADNGDKDVPVKDNENLELSDYFSPEALEEWKEFEKEVSKQKELEAILQSNKSVRLLWNLLESSGGNYTDSEELEKKIEDIGIYTVAPPTISLQEAVNYSRHREKSNDEAVLRMAKSDRQAVETFLSDTYNMSEVCAIFHELNYPSDYQCGDGNMCLAVYDQDRITVGSHEGDYSEVHLDDIRTWPLYNAEDVDIDVECEVNFQHLLNELKSRLGGESKKKTYIDVGIRVPYSQLSKASSYEIRLIDYLHKLNFVPRVSVCIFRQDHTVEERACFFLTYIEMTVYPGN